MPRNWYTIHTYSGHENKVKTSIERRAESMGQREKIHRILVPTETEIKPRAGKAGKPATKVEVKRKLFPGYVLIEMDMDDTTWYLVKSTTGVTGFIPPPPPGNKPTPMPNREAQEILDAMEVSAPIPVIKYEKGDVVRVTAGPFTEFNGKIENVDAPKEKLKVLISIFGRDTPVELDFSQVEKVV